MKIPVIFVICVTIHEIYGQMSEKQLKAAGTLIRNVCQPKNKVTNDQIDAIHKGVFEENSDIMCYTECCLRMGKLFKDNQFDYENAKKLVLTIPEERKEVTLVTVDNCKDSASSDDKCIAGYQVYKCLYNDNPANFFLP